MNTILPDGEAVIDEVVAVLGSFMNGTEALARAIQVGDGAAMCEAAEGLVLARGRALALVGREPLAV